MDSLTYFKLANSLPELNPGDFSQKIKVNLLTNFTDDILAKMLTGAFINVGIYPEFFKVPYKQYVVYLKNKDSKLFSAPAQVTYIFFDISSYMPSELAAQSGEEFPGLLEDIKDYCQKQQGIVVMNSFIRPYVSAYGNLYGDNPLFNLVGSFNDRLQKLAAELPNFYVFDTNQLIHSVGEDSARDMRGMYAFDIPFKTDFFEQLTRHWINYALNLLGRVKKCIVLDLDNVLWGGVLGEVGVDGIALGPTYPGVAFQNFQRALLEYYERGVLLAINSRNNERDVEEVFSQHPYMLLKPQHFAASRINWKNKADNFLEIAKELNLGLDSMVFLDDDPVNRDWVRQNVGQVLVPEFSLEPEYYSKTLHDLPVFTPFNLTAEDKLKGQMYSQEKRRTSAQAASQTFDDYLKQLLVKLEISLNNASQIPRLSQMTLKTNQFNFTTKRYTEKDIEKLMQEGLVFAADISDKFGGYGITALAIITKDPGKEGGAILDSFLLSCRVLGRGVERSFFDFLIGQAFAAGFKVLSVPFFASAKNVPAREFLDKLGLSVELETNESLIRRVVIPEYLSNLAEPESITINYEKKI